MKAPPVNSTVSSIESDSIELERRGLGTLPPSLRVVFSFPWLEREALHNRGVHPWSLILLKIIALRLTQILIHLAGPQLDPQLDRVQAPLLANLSCPTKCEGGLKSMFYPYNCGELRVGQRSLEGPANGCTLVKKQSNKDDNSEGSRASQRRMVEEEYVYSEEQSESERLREERRTKKRNDPISSESEQWEFEIGVNLVQEGEMALQMRKAVRKLRVMRKEKR
ncbi:unnamed protein product [Microthlaspi erraticum]|uniref:Uncharacterized protein n=1 Tax=Microthlaspi erraticum TaxID=1685480 RepID=A0A6D2IJP7_9BRAS|nr:unnamed protein product [Microthlaspi erraticum]